MYFEISNITISESKCLIALSVINSDIDSHVQLSILTIINSHNNILSTSIIGSGLRSKLILTGNTTFLSNQGSILLFSGAIEFEDFVLISDNAAHEYESIFQVSDSCCAYFKGEIVFTSNTGKQGEAVSAYNSNLCFDGNMTFIGNVAHNGGAISLKEGAKMNLKLKTHLYIFKANIANTYGGGIYVDDANLWIRKRVKCFINIDYEASRYYSVQFDNNSAGIARAALYGGWIDLCRTKKGAKTSKIFKFKRE